MTAKLPNHDLDKAMPTQRQDEQHTGREKQERQRLCDLIGKQVIDALGQPDGLHRVQVRPLWEDHYRVNVLVGVDAASTRVAHSYFLMADSGGSITASTPKITRQY